MKYFFLVILLLSCNKIESNVDTLDKDKSLDLRYEVLNQLIDEDIPSQSNYLYISILGIVSILEGKDDEPKMLGVNIKYDSIFYKKIQCTIKVRKK